MAKATFTRVEAVERLVEMGFAFNSERGDFEKGDLRGRLSWSPDFDDPSDSTSGTRFWLTRPNGEGEIPVLGGQS